jgi:photosystem II stability/assembly factor-like uncharacterized protein
VPQHASSLPLLGALAAFVVVVAIATGLLAALGYPTGEPATGSNTTRRPYVGGDLHAIAVDPTNPEKVMVGGHGGAAMSEDGGRNWEQIEDLEGADPMGWVINPRDPQKMYVGGHPGFYRSEDGGESWTQDNAGLPGTDVHGLGMDLQDPQTLYAYIVGHGLYRSPDAGESWRLVNAGLSMMGPILVDPLEPETLYIAVENMFLKSIDGGRSWQRVSTIPGGMTMWVSQDRQDPTTFYAANGGVYKSTNGGETWQPIGIGLPDNVSVVAVSPSDSTVVYAGALEKETVTVYRSEDGGRSWRAVNR